MITKIYEISCDQCGNAEHFHAATQKEAKQMARKSGWLKSNKEIFDSKSCAILKGKDGK